MIDNALSAAGITAAAIGFDKLGQSWVFYNGLSTLGAGSVLSGLILGAVTVFIIDRHFAKAAFFSLAGATFTFFGFIHSEAIGIGKTIEVASSYFIVAPILFVFDRIRPVNYIA